LSTTSARTTETRPPEATREGPSRGEGLRTIRLLLSFAAGRRRLFVFALIMLAAESITAVYEPLPLKYAIDYFNSLVSAAKAPTRFLFITLPSSRLATIVILGSAIVLLAAINSAADSAAEIFLAKAGRLLGFNMRVRLYGHLQKLSLAFHNQRRTGDVVARITGDVSTVEDFVMGNLSDIAGSILILIWTMVVLLATSWQVTLAALAIVPIVSVISNWFSQRIKQTAKRQRAKEGDLASAAQEMLSSIRVIQTFGRADYEEERFARQSGEAANMAMRTARLEAGFSWSVSVLEALATALVIVVGNYFIGHGTLTVGTLVFLILVIQNMFKPTRRIIKEWAVIGKIYAAAERIGEVLDRQPSVIDLPGAEPAPTFRGDLQFRHVSFAYSAEPEDSGGIVGDEARIALALNDVTFDARPGEVIAVVGPSGAGKSTIVQLIPRLYDPQEGGVFIDGRNIRAFSIDSVRRQISMVLQEAILFSGTVGENIAYGRIDAEREEIVRAAKAANAHTFIESMPGGYDAALNERGANLSGGQRQRIAIARAFIRNTPILILDEPTTGLDAESTDAVLEALHRLMRDKTTIIISHDLGLIRSADQILVVDKGGIVERGRHEELLEQAGLYASLHARQFGREESRREPGSPRPGDEQEVEPPSPALFETILDQALPFPADVNAYRRVMGGASNRQSADPDHLRADAETAPTESSPPG
jgi:ABC-type multidrug transport system fused ATPase/permease subunit